MRKPMANNTLISCENQFKSSHPEELSRNFAACITHLLALRASSEESENLSEDLEKNG